MRAHALELLLTSDEGSYPGLVPHAYEMSKMILMLELHSRVKLSKKLSRQ